MNDVGTPIDGRVRRKAWFTAVRLRTLPLALASTFTGAFLALAKGPIDVSILIMTAITTVFLQINSNLANDYGDFSHGTDNDERIGPERAMQSGIISALTMRRAIWLTSFLSLLSGTVLLYLAPLDISTKFVLFLFGVAAIYASIRYTAGKDPYGYRGLGDVSVMAFFGILGVVGSYLCQTGALEWTLVFPAIAIGSFSTGVLNINNTRDIESDKNAGKITLAVRLGPQRARWYHIALILIGCVALLVYALLHFEWGWDWLFLAAYPLFALNAWKVWSVKEASRLDPMLKQLALSTFLLALLIGVGALI
jgi:1,4-dihydroxy-2-naphthoate octaprenyltransferase